MYPQGDKDKTATRELQAANKMKKIMLKAALARKKIIKLQ